MRSMYSTFLVLALAAAWVWADRADDLFVPADAAARRAVDAVSRDIVAQANLNRNTRLIAKRYTSSRERNGAISYLITIGTDPPRYRIDAVVIKRADGQYELESVGKVLPEQALQRTEPEDGFFISLLKKAAGVVSSLIMAVGGIMTGK